MTGLDPNVLVRHIVQDDGERSLLSTRPARSLSVESPGFVAQVSVVELGWVLKCACDLEPKQNADAFDRAIA
ncbi:hypothetical protein [Accumulibacter sp.]|uniref:hypothetical protein n=1 Tax=Accumulibacter sp. TaxID=2053492 RepID=UPI0035B4C159